MLVLADLRVIHYLCLTSHAASPRPRFSRARSHQPPASPLRNAAPPPLRWRTARHRRGRRAASPSSTPRSQRSTAPPAGRLRQPASGAALHRSRSASGWEKTPFRVAPTGPPVDAGSIRQIAPRNARPDQPPPALPALSHPPAPRRAAGCPSRPDQASPHNADHVRWQTCLRRWASYHTVHSTCMARRTPCRPWNEPLGGLSTDLPFYPRARSGRVNTACGAALRAAGARNLQHGQAAPVAEPKNSAPDAPRPCPVAHPRC